ncbi:MAG: collagen binding domain-containing protein [Acidobacteriota bacterium]
MDFPPAEDLLLRLVPEDPGWLGEIQGTLTGADGKPLAARVRLRSEGLSDFREVETDEEGRYGISPLQPGRYWLEFVAIDYSESNRHRLSLTVEPGAVQETNFQFTGRENLSGVVLSESGTALRGVHLMIQAWERSPFLFYTTRADEEGRFRFQHIEAGTYQVIIRAPEANQAEFRTLVEVPTRADTVFTLESAVTLEGTLVDLRGRPILEFGLSINPTHDQESGTSRRVRTVNGSFVIKGLHPDLYQIEIGLKGGQTFSQVLDVMRGRKLLLVVDPSREEGEIRILYGQ